MNETFAQGDLLIERVADAEPSGTLLAPDTTGAWVLAEGEVTGHRHAISVEEHDPSPTASRRADDQPDAFAAGGLLPHAPYRAALPRFTA